MRRPNPNPTPRLLTLQQVQVQFGINSKTAWDLTTRGVLPAVRLPGVRRVYIRESDVLDLIESSTVAVKP